MTPYKAGWRPMKPKKSKYVAGSKSDLMESQVALTIIDSMAMSTAILFAQAGKRGLAPLWWAVAGAGFVKLLHDASEISL